MKERFQERFPLIRPLLVPMILYLGLLAMATSFVDQYPTSPWRLPVLLAPMIPGLFIALGMLQAIRKLDEMNRKIILESTAVAFALTLFLSIALGLLQMGGLVQVSYIYLSLFMALTWLVAKIVITNRYVA